MAEPHDLAEDLVAFFRGLPPAERAQLQALAELDRRFGEDVSAEQRQHAGRETR